MTHYVALFFWNVLLQYLSLCLVMFRSVVMVFRCVTFCRGMIYCVMCELIRIELMPMCKAIFYWDNLVLIAPTYITSLFSWEHTCSNLQKHLLLHLLFSILHAYWITSLPSQAWHPLHVLPLFLLNMDCQVVLCY